MIRLFPFLLLIIFTVNGLSQTEVIEGRWFYKSRSLDKRLTIKKTGEYSYTCTSLPSHKKISEQGMWKLKEHQLVLVPNSYGDSTKANIPRQFTVLPNYYEGDKLQGDYFLEQSSTRQGFMRVKPDSIQIKDEHLNPETVSNK